MHTHTQKVGKREEGERARARVREKIFQLLDHYTNAQNIQGWAKLKPEARNSVWVSFWHSYT